MKETISLLTPFSIERTMDAVRGQNPRLVLAHPEYPVFTKVIPAEGRDIPVTVSLVETSQGPAAEVELLQACNSKETEAIRVYVGKMLSNHVDLRPFYAQLQDEPVIGSILPGLHGLKILLEPNLFQNLVRTIIGQQMNLSFAASLVSRITEQYGTPVTIGDHTLYSFPKPEALAALEPDELLPLQFSRRKAEYITGLARQVADGSLDLNAMPDLADEEIFNRLLPIRGVGKWTVECFLLFSVGRTDFFPADDIGLKNAMKVLWGFDSQPASPLMLEISRSWSPWRSYAAYYLWAWLDDWKLRQKQEKEQKKPVRGKSARKASEA
ncbi:DNA-3-methyladenine glycosylase [Paenibacillus sp. AR247]|uniref:DNA-3-methyladenine glycosylase family protein n=1 Tax=Paenibacillus sp. AR247 TaxID=1631599 RepID=UPI000CFA748D|nr:DNA-3-methyladenine glycosylase [Paenibacillus sp. AR247]PQP86626.1 hypothetical protein CPT76_30520 [Paenibacillus sp. AR247]